MTTAKAHLIYQFKVALQEIEPPIWRKLQVPAQYSFWDLHVALQDAMGWLDYHLHVFRLHRPHQRKMIEIGIRLWCMNRFDPSGELRAGFSEACEVSAANHR
jgi:hypothetical protein